MAIYYIRKSGNDGNSGLLPTDAWLTIGKALGAAGISSGDTVYVGAGTYRETVTVAMIGAIAETSIVADVDGSHAGDVGEVIWTAYTVNDKTNPTNQPLMNLDGRSFLTFDGFYFVGGNHPHQPSIVESRTLTSTNITFRRCVFNSGALGECIHWLANPDTPAHFLIDHCVFLAWGYSFNYHCIYIEIVDANTADMELDFVILNSVFMLGAFYRTGVYMFGYGSIFSMGGPLVQNCLFFGGYNQVNITGITTTNPAQVYHCTMLGAANWSITDDLPGIVVEDYNFVSESGFVDGNVTSGGHSINGPAYAPLLSVHQELWQNRMLRPFLSPIENSPLLGFGNSVLPAPLTIDFSGRPRPAGGQLTNAVGPFERHDTATREAGTFDVTPGIVITGPGDHDFKIPVDATSTTISVKARYDAAHGAGNKPQAILLANPEIGITAETQTMTAAANTWETLIFAAQTPTAPGVVTVRLISRSAATNGHAYFDTFAVT